jgi:nitroreductase
VEDLPRTYSKDQLVFDSETEDEKPRAPKEPRFKQLKPYPIPPDARMTTREFYRLMNERRSIRRFSAEPIDREVLENAIRTAGTAPSGANVQPWYFAVIQSRDLKEKLRKEAEEVETAFYTSTATAKWQQDLAHLGTGPKKDYLSVAPAIIAVFTRTEVDSERSYYPMESTGIAVGLLLASLHQAGLATLTHTPRPMFFLNSVLNLDRTYKPFMLVVTGYPEEPVMVPDISRRPLEAICNFL